MEHQEGEWNAVDIWNTARVLNARIKNEYVNGLVMLSLFQIKEKDIVIGENTEELEWEDSAVYGITDARTEIAQKLHEDVIGTDMPKTSIYNRVVHGNVNQNQKFKDCVVLGLDDAGDPCARTQTENVNGQAMLLIQHLKRDAIGWDMDAMEEESSAVKKREHVVDGCARKFILDAFGKGLLLHTNWKLNAPGTVTASTRFNVNVVHIRRYVMITSVRRRIKNASLLEVFMKLVHRKLARLQNMMISICASSAAQQLNNVSGIHVENTNLHADLWVALFEQRKSL
jgi:hypothetical protein